MLTLGLEQRRIVVNVPEGSSWGRPVSQKDSSQSRLGYLRDDADVLSCSSGTDLFVCIVPMRVPENACQEEVTAS
jgi:hypothetical protein